MSPERDDPTDDQDLYEDVPPRSIFAATWFRVVLVLIVLGVFGAVAVPYVLDWMNPAPVSRSVSAKATSPATPAAPVSPPPASESAPSSSASSSSSAEKSSTTEKSSSVDKKDPALASPAPPPSLAKPEPKPESKPAPVAKAPAPKSEAKSAAPADTAKSDSSAKSESAAKSPAAAKTESAPKSQAVAKAETAKDESKTATATTPPATKRAAAKATPTENPAHKVTGPFWVQVGAFRDADTAKRVATALRDQSYKVEESDTKVSAKAASAASSSSAAPSPAASPGDLYDVYVTGMSAVELTKRLSAKGLSAEASGGSVVVKPSLPLRDAVSLSKDLAVDGLKVQVRRAGSGAVAMAPATTAPASPATPGETLHRVRVGPFTEVAAVRSAAKELEGKGYKPFIARGDE